MGKRLARDDGVWRGFPVRFGDVIVAEKAAEVDGDVGFGLGGHGRLL